MDATPYNPKTLVEAIKYYADVNVATLTLSAVRWPNGVECPRCASREKHSYVSTRRIWKCKSCRKQFSPKVGTIFEDSPLGLDLWLTAIWMITNDKNGISSYELHRGLGVTQTTGWFMLHRIRLAMQTGSFSKFTGHVEADETFIGAKARNMHKHIRARKIKGTGPMGKIIVLGLLERKGQVRVRVSLSTKRKPLHDFVKENVEPGSTVYSDALKSYEKLGSEYIHQVVDHAEKYVEGQIHTNGLENFWSLFKRCINGTYISVAPFHLFRYLDEETFRYNQRKDIDGDGGRFNQVMKNTCGRRLTFKELTGKVGENIVTDEA
jgi:transposase-like protein